MTSGRIQLAPPATLRPQDKDLIHAEGGERYRSLLMRCSSSELLCLPSMRSEMSGRLSGRLRISEYDDCGKSERDVPEANQERLRA
jgi:hypothetical protein